jgi:hypothetical protein
LYFCLPATSTFLCPQICCYSFYVFLLFLNVLCFSSSLFYVSLLFFSFYVYLLFSFVLCFSSSLFYVSLLFFFVLCFSSLLLCSMFLSSSSLFCVYLLFSVIFLDFYRFTCACESVSKLEPIYHCGLFPIPAKVKKGERLSEWVRVTWIRNKNKRTNGLIKQLKQKFLL